ncbi:MAG: hypothetical protein LBR64_10120 [Dysgonamonadaceae bacterium]|jgi:hypothetical protein|nr:hypothetical protein [Dysgonamonadaceae bacterium]
METNLANGAAVRKYEKPMTKKHEAVNTVQGSALYYSGSSLYSGGLYYVSLYYYY